MCENPQKYYQVDFLINLRMSLLSDIVKSVLLMLPFLSMKLLEMKAFHRRFTCISSTHKRYLAIGKEKKKENKQSGSI